MIGERMRRLIKRRGLKQIEVCRAVSLSPSRLSNYLSGSREPDLETLSRIARFLDVKIDYFAYGDTVKSTKDTGERIVKLREMLSMSKKELADQAGMDEADLSRLELGHGEFERETIENLSQALRCDSDYLLGSRSGFGHEGDVVMEREAVAYELDTPDKAATISDMAAGKADTLGDEFWVVVNDGRFAPKIKEEELLYLSLLKDKLPEEGDRLLYVSSGFVRFLRCFEYQDSVLLTPETGGGEPIFVSRNDGMSKGTKVYKVLWQAIKY